MCDFSILMAGCWVLRRQFTVVYLLSGSLYMEITTWPEFYLSVLGYGWTTEISQRNLWRGHWMKCWRIRGKEFLNVINWVLIFSNILLATLPLKFEVFWIWVNLTLMLHIYIACNLDASNFVAAFFLRMDQFDYVSCYIVFRSVEKQFLSIWNL